MHSARGAGKKVVWKELLKEIGFKNSVTVVKRIMLIEQKFWDLVKFLLITNFQRDRKKDWVRFEGNIFLPVRTR